MGHDKNIVRDGTSHTVKGILKLIFYGLGLLFSLLAKTFHALEHGCKHLAEK